MTDVLLVIISFLKIYKLVLLARILMSWLPNINWYNQPFKFLRDVTDPVMVPFSRLIPPIGGIDFSPMLLFFVIGLLQSGLENLAIRGMG